MMEDVILITFLKKTSTILKNCKRIFLKYNLYVYNLLCFYNYSAVGFVK